MHIWEERSELKSVKLISLLICFSTILKDTSYELSKLIPEEFKGSMPTIEEIEAEFGDID